MVSFKSIATVFSLGVAANAVALESRQLGDCNVLSEQPFGQKRKNTQKKHKD